MRSVLFGFQRNHRVNSSIGKTLPPMQAWQNDSYLELFALAGGSTQQRVFEALNRQHGDKTPSPVVLKIGSPPWVRPALSKPCIRADSQPHSGPPGPSAHNLGTCRLSYRPEDGVCNKWGGRLTISKTYSSRMVASSQPARQKIRPRQSSRSRFVKRVTLLIKWQTVSD